MNLTKTNKTLIICLIFIFGIIASLLDLIPYFALICLFIFIYCIYSKIISYKFSLVCLLTFVFSIFYTGYRTPVPDNLVKIAPVNVCIRGRVTTQPKDISEYRKKFELKIISYKTKNSDWTPVKAKTLVTVSTKEKIQNIYLGDFIEFFGHVRVPYKAANPGQFDYRKYLGNSGIFTTTYVKSKDINIIEHPKSGKWFLMQKLNRIENKIVLVHEKNLKSPKLEVLGGIVFGDYAVPPPDDVKQNFISSGLLHLLAASGMNVALIFGLWAFIAKKISVPQRSSIIIGAILVLFYALLTGMPPSVVRATWMIEFVLLGKFLDKEADIITLLALVCSIMLLFDPLIVTNIGFQLSFIVTFGILLNASLFMDKVKPIPVWLSGTILVPIIAQVWAEPLQLYHFNTFATYSVIANVFTVPFIGIVSFMGFISSILGLITLIGSPVCWIMDKCTEPFLIVLLYITRFTATLPGALYYFATPKIIAVILFYILILILTLQIKLNFSKKLLNFIILGLILAIVFISIKDCFSKDLKLLFFSVGEADSILIQTPDKHNILVDTANIEKNNFCPAKTIIIPYLKNKGIYKLDAILLTHPDSDHIGGTLDLLKNIKINQLFDNGEKSNSKVYRNIQEYVRKNKIPERHLHNGEEINIDKAVKIRVIKPLNTDDKSNNDTSLILYIKYKKFSALLMGDAEAGSLYALKNYVKSPVNIIKIGHHGSHKSVNYEFLKYLNPKTAIISVGKNEYHHPNTETLKTLKKFKIQTFRTDKDFAIEATMNSNNINISSFNKI